MIQYQVIYFTRAIVFQDIPENGYDEAHLQHLHLPFHLSGVNLATQFDSNFNIADNVMTVLLLRNNTVPRQLTAPLY